MYPEYLEVVKREINNVANKVEEIQANKVIMKLNYRKKVVSSIDFISSQEFYQVFNI